MVKEKKELTYEDIYAREEKKKREAELRSKAQEALGTNVGSRLKQQIERVKEKQQLNKIKRLRADEAYYKTPSGKVSKGATRVAGILTTKRGITKALYSRTMPVSIGSASAIRTGKRGRPFGTYDPRYAAYGGVYGFRRAQSQMNRQQRQQYLQNIAQNPQQQAALAYIEARRKEKLRQQQQIFPDVRNDAMIAESNIFNQLNIDVDNASNLVP